MIRNWFIFFIGVQQVGAGVYSLYLKDWRIGGVMMLVGFANFLMSTLEG